MGTLAGRYDTSKPSHRLRMERGHRSLLWRMNMRIAHLDTQQFELVRLLFSIGLTVLVCVGSLLSIRYLIGSPLELNARPAPRTPIGAPTIRGHKTKARPPSQSSKTQGSAAAKPKNADAVQPTNQGARQ